MKRIVEIQDSATVPVMGLPVGLWNYAGSLYAVCQPNSPPVFVGLSSFIPDAKPDFAPVLTQSAGGEITPDHLIKLAAVILQPGTVADLYGKV